MAIHRIHIWTANGHYSRQATVLDRLKFLFVAPSQPRSFFGRNPDHAFGEDMPHPFTPPDACRWCHKPKAEHRSD